MTNSESEIVAKLMAFALSSGKCNDAANLQVRLVVGFRRFVALAWITDSESIGADMPAWKVAEALGVSPARFSQLCRGVSERGGGSCAPSMRSASHRSACAAAKHGRSVAYAPRRPATTSIVEVPATAHRAAEAVGIRRAIQSFRDGKPWTKNQRRLLYRAGMIGLDGVLTAAGVSAMDAAGDAPQAILEATAATPAIPPPRQGISLKCP